MTSPALRLAFPKGCRVRLSAMGKLVARRRKPDRIGTVVGWSWNGQAPRILWDGLRQALSWYRDYVERVDPDA